MGSTTAKARLIRDGKPSITNDFRVGGRVSIGGRSTGTPIKIPVIDLAEVGAGGGSIAWVDSVACRRSARTVPALAGSRLLRLWRRRAHRHRRQRGIGLLRSRLLPGRKTEIYPEASRAAIAKVAEKLKLDMIAAADGRER